MVNLGESVTDGCIEKVAMMEGDTMTCDGKIKVNIKIWRVGSKHRRIRCTNRIKIVLN